MAASLVCLAGCTGRMGFGRPGNDKGDGTDLVYPTGGDVSDLEGDSAGGDHPGSVGDSDGDSSGGGDGVAAGDGGDSEPYFQIPPDHFVRHGPPGYWGGYSASGGLWCEGPPILSASRLVFPARGQTSYNATFYSGSAGVRRIDLDGYVHEYANLSGDSSTGSHAALVAAATTDGGYLSAGVVGAGLGSYDIVVALFSDTDSRGFTRAFGTAENDDVLGLSQTSDGEVAIAGYQYTTGSTSIWKVTTQGSGSVTWGVRLELPVETVEIAATDDGGVLMAAHEAAAADLFLARLTSSGALAWQKYLEVSVAGPFFVRTKPDGSFALLVTTGPPLVDTPSLWLAAFDGAGTKVWEWLLDDQGNQTAAFLNPTNNGDWLVMEKSSLFTPSWARRLSRLTATGSFMWQNVMSDAQSPSVGSGLCDFVGEDANGRIVGSLGNSGLVFRLAADGSLASPCEAVPASPPLSAPFAVTTFERAAAVVLSTMTVSRANYVFNNGVETHEHHGYLCP